MLFRVPLLLLGLSACNAFGMVVAPAKTSALAHQRGQRRALLATVFMSEDAPEAEAAAPAPAYKPTDVEIANEMRDMPRKAGEIDIDAKRARAIQRLMDKYDPVAMAAKEAEEKAKKAAAEAKKAEAAKAAEAKKAAAEAKKAELAAAAKAKKEATAAAAAKRKEEAAAKKAEAAAVAKAKKEAAAAAALAKKEAAAAAKAAKIAAKKK